MVDLRRILRLSSSPKGSDHTVVDSDSRVGAMDGARVVLEFVWTAVFAVHPDTIGLRGYSACA